MKAGLGGRLAGGAAAILLLAAEASPAGKKVVVLKSKAIPLLEVAAKGFKRCLPDKSADVEEMVLPEGAAQAEAAVAALPGAGASLIFAVGVQAALLAREKAKSVPSVFCMVIDPGASGLSKGGVSLDPKPSDYLDYLRRSFPQFKRVGVLYNPSRSKAQALALKAAAAAPQEVVLKEVTDVSGLDAALKAVKAEADCLLMVVDTSIYNPQTASQIILQTLQMDLPLIAAMASFVKAGALAGVYADSADNGCQAAEMAGKALGGEPALGMPVQAPRKMASTVNLVVGNRLKVVVSPSARAAAEEVLE